MEAWALKDGRNSPEPRRLAQSCQETSRAVALAGPAPILSALSRALQGDTLKACTLLVLVPYVGMLSFSISMARLICGPKAQAASWAIHKGRFSEAEFAAAKVSPSGVKYNVVREGYNLDGSPAPKPVKGQAVRFHYVARLPH